MGGRASLHQGQADSLWLPLAGRLCHARLGSPWLLWSLKMSDGAVAGGGDEAAAAAGDKDDEAASGG